MSRNLRDTPQRQVILEELAKMKSHPTANDIYEVVRKRLPKISLGTVYRNLELLSSAGFIQKLEIVGAQKRFDDVVNNHYHIRCVECGKIDDLIMPTISSINDIANNVSDYKILWHRLEFAGVCPECLRRKPKTIGNSRS
ncbi:MAG: Fur family transcriptional regulator [Desulfomonilaceae bacterium]